MTHDQIGGVLFALIGGLFIHLYNILTPERCPECPHCNAIERAKGEKKEKRRQAREAHRHVAAKEITERQPPRRSRSPSLSERRARVPRSPAEVQPSDREPETPEQERVP